MDNKLLEIVATGKSKHYFGKKYKSEEIKELSEDDKLALYEGYKLIEQSELALAMKDTFVSGIAELSCSLFGIKNKEGLTEDLRNDPFTEKFVGVVTSSLYGSLGYFFAPISIGSIIGKHKLKERYDESDGEIINEDSNAIADGMVTLYQDENGSPFHYGPNGERIPYQQDVANAVNQTLAEL